MKKIYKILPLYAFVPIAASLILNVLVYYGGRVLTTDRFHYNFSIWIDRELPFVAPMIIIYVLAYVAWIVGFVVIGRESREVCYEVMSAEQIAKLMCFACFLIIPSTIVRPEVTGTGFCQWLTRYIYSMDAADNLFPSIHCLENWICFRGAMRCKKVGKGYKVVMFVAALLVFASTILVKQHVFIDIIGGIAVVEIGLFLAKKLNTARIYYALEEKINKLINNKKISKTNKI